MRHLIANVIRAAASMLGCALVTPVAGGVEPKATDYYPLAEGNKWEYKLTLGKDESPLTVVVTKSEKQKDRTDVSLILRGATGSGLTEELSIDGNGIHLRVALRQKLEPSRMVLKPTLKSGDSWAQKYKAGEIGESVKTAVKEPVEVEVPAGKFRTFPVETLIESGNQKSVTTTWFAEKVGIVKMVSKTGSLTTTLELKKFIPAK